MKRLKHIIIALSMMLVGSFAAFAAPAPAVGIVVETPSAEAEVRVVHGGITVATPEASDSHVMVYAITGRLVHESWLPSGSVVTIDLPSGYYIVNVDGNSRRVVVK